MKLAIYARVSTSDQTCEQQLTALREYSSRLGAKSVAEYIETASGADDDRPVHARLMEAARRRKVDCICVVKLDRFGRSLQKLVRDIQDLTSYGCRFIAIDQAIDTDKKSATGQLLIHIMAAFAEFERTLISDRTKAGIARARAGGSKIGRPSRTVDVVRARELVISMKSYRKAAAQMGLPLAVLHRALNPEVDGLHQTPND